MPMEIKADTIEWPGWADLLCKIIKRADPLIAEELELMLEEHPFCQGDVIPTATYRHLRTRMERILNDYMYRSATGSSRTRPAPREYLDQGYDNRT